MYLIGKSDHIAVMYGEYVQTDVLGKVCLYRMRSVSYVGIVVVDYLVI